MIICGMRRHLPIHHKNAVTYFKKRERNKAITKSATRHECVLHDNPTYACSTRLQMTMTRDCRHFKAACTAYQSKSLNIHLFIFSRLLRYTSPVTHLSNKFVHSASTRFSTQARPQATST